MMSKRILLLTALLFICAVPLSASALDVNEWRWQPDFAWNLADADLVGLNEDAELPVYGAPFEDAWRGAQGKASMPAAKSFTILGTLQGRTWAMVDYRIDNRSNRIGWVQIDPDHANEWGPSTDLEIQRTLCSVSRTVKATDDPRGSSREIRTLAPGEQVIAMFALDDRMCVETEVDGKVAWLFVDADALEELTLYTVEDNTLRFDSRVTHLGNCAQYNSYYDEDDDWVTNVRTLIRPGDIAGGGFDLVDLAEETDQPMGVSLQVELPEHLRYLGDGSFYAGNLTELRLPETLEGSGDEAVYGCSIHRLILPSGFVGELPSGTYTTIDAYEAEDGNPRYSSRDGVLFSADGKTLIKYPSGRKETHYDVPAGVEAIADSAFDNDQMGVMLQTISLPIGLKSIGKYAFSGCGRLQSLTVPLTVTELSDSAFFNCVSLERLSLPPGLNAEFDGYAQQSDFTWYVGDNGATEVDTDPLEERRARFRYFSAWTDTPSGEGTVLIYRDLKCMAVLREMPVGTPVTVKEVKNGIAQIEYSNGRTQFSGWIPLDRLMTRPTGEPVFEVTGLLDTVTGKYYDYYSFDYRNGVLEVAVRTGNDSRWTEVPRENYALLHNSRGSRTLAMLVAPNGVSIRLYDEPDGTEIAHTYTDEQAVVLEQRGDWVLVRTVRTCGWVRTNQIWQAVPMNAGQ